jgi:biopolymer transport protein ExbD
MIKLEDLRRTPEAAKLGKTAAIAAGVWLIALIVFLAALSAANDNSDRLDEAETVTSAATVIKSYPVRTDESGNDSLSSAASVIDELGLKDRIGQLSSSASGLVIQADRLYPGEFTKLVSLLSEKGLNVNTAEVRAMQQSGQGRLISVTLAVGGRGK